MSAAEYYKANVGLVHAIAKRGLGRLGAAKVAIEYDDVFQEMSVVFLKAYEGFDESRGFKFSTYYYMAAYNHLNHWADKLIKERLRDGLVSLEEFHNPNEDESLEAILYVDDSQSPELQYRVTELLEHIERMLSPLAALILTWTAAPPPELMREVQKAQLNAEFGRSKGLNSRCMVQVTPRFVGTFLSMVSDVTQAEVRQALREIDTLRHEEIKNYLGA